MARGRDGISDYSKKEILSTIFKQTNLGFIPLEKENYSNTNYALLAELIERVSGQPFPDFLKAHIFALLGMSKSEIQLGKFYTSSKIDIATGYYKRDKGDVNFTPEKEKEANHQEEAIYGAGGIKANIHGLIKWMSNYKTGRLKNGNLLIDELLHKDTLSNGELTRYARGLEDGVLKSGYKWVQHTGRGATGTSIMLWLPEFDISIIALFNTDEIWAQSVTNKFLKDIVDSLDNHKQNLTESDNSTIEESTNTTSKKEVPQPSIVPQPEVSLSMSELNKFVGLYPAGAPVGSHVPPSGGVGIDKITLNEGKLQYILYNGYAINLKPISNTVLEMTGVGRPIQLRFINIESERPGIVSVDPMVNNGKPSDEVTYRIPQLETSVAKSFCGKYKSPTVDKAIPIEILFEDGKLYMQWGILKKRSQLYYLDDDILTTWKDGKYGMQCNLIIKRNSKGQITGFTYDGHRAWNLFFNKI